MMIMRSFSLLLLAFAVCFSTVACTPERLPELVDQIPADGGTGNDDADGKDGGTGNDDADGNDGETGNDDANGKDGETGNDDADGNEESEDKNQPEEAMTIKITVGGKVFSADIEASETGRAFIAKLPLTLNMSELNGNEKYCYGVSLPRADKYFGTIAAGDLMLYSGNCIVLFYGSAGGYSYTRIGCLQSTDGLAAALGHGSATVTFSR